MTAFGAGRGLGRIPRLLLVPAGFVAVFAAGPALLLVAASLAHQDFSGTWRPGFEASHYGDLFQATFLKPLATSFALALATAAITLAIAFPVTYLIARLKRRAQVAWLVCLLTSLSLSEVLVVFAWQTLLSARVGLSLPLVWLGLLDRPVSLSPSLGAAIAGLVYLVLPYVILLLYPALSRLDPEIPQAASTMGCSPARAFMTVVLPMTRGPLLTAGVGIMVTTVGAYLTPLVLAKPQQWTVGILINRSVMEDGNVPLGAAQAIGVVLLMIALLVLARRLSPDPEA
jgi:putative spermidine/putrescine transport system permease protein